MEQSENKITEDLEKEGRLGLHERNVVQKMIIKKMLESGAVKTEMEWAEDYRKIVSDIIDNPQNVNIRELIKEGDEDNTKYDQTADLIISLLPDISTRKAA